MCRTMWYSSTMPLPPNMSRATRAISSDLPHELRFTIDIISGVTLRRESKLTHTCTCSNELHQRYGEFPRFCSLVFVFQPADLVTRLQADRDLSHHVRHLLLHQLVRCQRCSELMPENKIITTDLPRFWRLSYIPIESVLPSDVETRLCSAERAPCNTVARVVQATERALHRTHKV